MKRKLKLVLALTQDAAARYAALLKDYAKFFKDSQGAFSGYKNTYQSVDAMIDDPSKRGYQRVVTTVPEKLVYFIDAVNDYITNVLTKERTNGMNVAKADLIFGEKTFPGLTSNELLCLKSILDRPELTQMIATIPVRTETDSWEKTTADEYIDREIFQKPLIEQENKTTTKEQYILSDPNITVVNAAAYKPQLGSKDTVVILGKQTRQEFSGQWTHTQRAKALERLVEFKKAVTIALEQANDVEVIEATLTSKDIFGYILNG